MQTQPVRKAITIKDVFVWLGSLTVKEMAICVLLIVAGGWMVMKVIEANSVRHARADGDEVFAIRHLSIIPNAVPKDLSATAVKNPEDITHGDYVIAVRAAAVECRSVSPQASAGVTEACGEAVARLPYTQ